MLPDEILFRILQASTAGSFVTLLIICMSMHEVKWWLPIPIYILAFSCLTTFLTTFFMRAYTLDMCVVTILCLFISAISTAIHSYIQPISKNRREALNRRILYWTIPIMTIFLGIWCVGVAFDGGSEFFNRLENKLGALLNNQQRMMARQDSLEATVKRQGTDKKKSDSASAAYRRDLDRRMDKIDDRLDNQSLGLQRINTNQQKSFRRND